MGDRRGSIALQLRPLRPEVDVKDCYGLLQCALVEQRRPEEALLVVENGAPGPDCKSKRVGQRSSELEASHANFPPHPCASRSTHWHQSPDCYENSFFPPIQPQDQPLHLLARECNDLGGCREAGVGHIPIPPHGYVPP